VNVRGLKRTVVLISLLAVPSILVQAQAAENRRIEEATVAFQDITAIPEKTIPEFLLQNARGIAIIPGVLKFGFVVGGEFGRGVLLLRDNDEGWSNPIFISLSGGSIGWQIGAQSTDIVLVFKTGKSVDGILRGKFTVGVDVAAAAGPVGRRARASTDVELKAEIYSYSRSRGFFAGLSLDGAILQIDDDGNADFYGDETITPQDILDLQNIKAPARARELQRTLEEFTESLDD